ncbi:TetR/AcrR family transcriptional regulator [Nocardioides marmoriginsengisoli]|uniref:TetR/AcrR family transcriptional regulator n=2 Tax=Nocardioides marmoriginsengisoli TaxID=661483 RepID=A0A3N0CH32_9ACTN|nr:TetR/AcrR family transcriptional regulator [Nocardioides marmoriginsengisoli]
MDGRAAVLRAAREVFAERGYGSATTREVLARAGTTSPTLHHHFGSKAGLYLAVLHDVVEEILVELTDAVSGHSSFLDRVDSMLDASVRLNEQDSTTSRLVFSAPVEVRQNPELASGSDRVGRLVDFVEDMCRESEDLALEPAEATRAIMTILYGLGRSAITLDQRQYEQVVAAMRAVIHGAFVRLPA